MFVVFALFDLFVAVGGPLPSVPVLFTRVILIAGVVAGWVARFFSEPMNRYLHRRWEKCAGVTGELFVVGGAVMCLAYAARPSTQSVNAVFRPAAKVREAAARVATVAGLSTDWLNDGVKGFLSTRGDYASFIELDHLHVMIAQPEYLLAMKCLAMRIGAEFHDEDDVRYLLRHLDVRSYEGAVAIIQRYYPLDRFPQKTLYALAELLPKPGLAMRRGRQLFAHIFEKIGNRFRWVLTDSFGFGQTHDGDAVRQRRAGDGGMPIARGAEERFATMSIQDGQ